jgi:maltoporin
VTSRGLPVASFACHYLRSGFGLNERGGKQDSFQIPYSLGRYRLGNEPGTYAELAFVQNWTWFKTEAMIEGDTQNTQSYDPSSQFRLREAFGQAGNVLGGRWRPVKFWAGNRYYLREDINILDYFVRDMSGYGGGAESIPIGFASVDLAYIGSLQPSNDYLTANASKSTVDVRLDKIKVPGAGVRSGTTMSSPDRTRWVDNNVLPSAAGNAIGFEHRRDEFYGGYHLFTFQAARRTGEQPIAHRAGADSRLA